MRRSGKYDIGLWTFGIRLSERQPNGVGLLAFGTAAESPKPAVESRWLKMRDHKKLDAFNIAHHVVLEIYRITRDFPQGEQFGLVAQMRRSAVSVSSNIVEGSARESQADYARFMDIAYGSAKELEYQVGLAHDLGYLEEGSFTTLSECCGRSARVLNGLVCSLRTRKSKAESTTLGVGHLAFGTTVHLPKPKAQSPKPVVQSPKSKAQSPMSLLLRSQTL
jgi:four helix bundle protein